jgi:glycosyltransferase involved in cell wall biosynthesis
MKFNLWTGAAWQDWAPNDIKEKGLGGSETAVVMMARELVKLGHEVTVYGQFPLDMDAVQDGARYVHYKYVTDPGQISGDVFVSSRDVHALMMQPKSKATAVWVHDINLGHDTFDRLDKYDTILCLSKWSAKAIEAYYPHVRRTKILVTRNGIDVSRFKPDVDADEILKQKPWPPHFVYASSPDRGLDKLLDFWPSIREMAPGTELHVYYGFDIWKLMAKGNPRTAAALAAAGCEVHTYPAREIGLNGSGGPTCMTRPILRG